MVIFSVNIFQAMKRQDALENELRRPSRSLHPSYASCSLSWKHLLYFGNYLSYGNPASSYTGDFLPFLLCTHIVYVQDFAGRGIGRRQNSMSSVKPSRFLISTSRIASHSSMGTDGRCGPFQDVVSLGIPDGQVLRTHERSSRLDGIGEVKIEKPKGILVCLPEWVGGPRDETLLFKCHRRSVQCTLETSSGLAVSLCLMAITWPLFHSLVATDIGGWYTPGGKYGLR